MFKRLSNRDAAKTIVGHLVLKGGCHECRACRNFLTTIASTGAPETVVAEQADDDRIFDPRSKVVQQTLANHGWNVGAIVAPKKVDPKEPKADEQMEIGHVNDDGTIGLHPLCADGSTNKAKVVMTDQVKLQTMYKSVDDTARLSKWVELSSEPPTVGQEFWLSVATQAIVVASYQHRKCPAGSIYIQKKPTVKVVVASVPTCNFVLTPHPAVVKKGKETSHIHLTVEAIPPVVFNIEKPDMEMLQVLEFWRMRRSTEKENANMQISMVEVVCPLPKLKGMPKSVTVQVPTAVPFTKIAPGDELVLYVPAKQKKEKVEKLLPVMQEPVQKKLRTVES